MGGRKSKVTILKCLIKNFIKGFGGDYGIKLIANKLRTFCERDWPSFGVGKVLRRNVELNKMDRVL